MGSGSELGLGYLKRSLKQGALHRSCVGGAFPCLENRPVAAPAKLRAAEGFEFRRPSGAGGHMDGVHAFGPGSIGWDGCGETMEMAPAGGIFPRDPDRTRFREISDAAAVPSRAGLIRAPDNGWTRPCAAPASFLQVDHQDGNIGRADARDAGRLSHGARADLHQFLTALRGEGVDAFVREPVRDEEVLGRFEFPDIRLLPLDVSGKFPASAIPGVPAVIQDGSITGAKIADGQMVRSINALRDEVLLEAGSNVNVAQVGNTITISATPGGGGGDITAVNAIDGLTGGAQSGDVTINGQSMPAEIWARANHAGTRSPSMPCTLRTVTAD